MHFSYCVKLLIVISEQNPPGYVFRPGILIKENSECKLYGVNVKNPVFPNLDDRIPVTNVLGMATFKHVKNLKFIENLENIKLGPKKPEMSVLKELEILMIQRHREEDNLSHNW